MNSPLHSPYADVAEDFREALSGLKANNKWEIENLTVIARENTENAHSISRVIESHIKSTAPPYKLPALYVLDSIVKNVGSPYNIILGRNLFSIFMEAYVRVDDMTRSQMQSMLNTWMQPIPGSLDPKPVFPVNTTTVIDNALKSSRASNLARQQRQPHGLPPRPPVAGSPRPPSWGAPSPNGAQYPPPSPQTNAYPYSGYPQPNGYPQYPGYPQQQPPTPQQLYHPPPQSGGYHTPVQPQSNFYPPTPQQAPPQTSRPPDYPKLHSDIENYINTIYQKLSVNPRNQSLNARLKAMLDLKTHIQSTHPTPQEWDRIRDQISLLVQQENNPPYNAPSYVHAPPTPIQHPQNAFPPAHQPTPSQQPPPQPTSQPSLAELLQGMPSQRTSTPQNDQRSFSAPANGTPAPSSGPVPGTNPNILDLLRNSGIITTPGPSSRPASTSQHNNSTFAPPPTVSQPSANTTSATGPPPATQAPADLAALLASLSQPKTNTQSLVPQGQVVELTSASIKIPRIDLMNERLFKAAPSQCKTCGRRFPATVDGKARKARHLDYHFRTNQRMAEAEGTGRRGICRAWYPNEHEWIKHREIDDADENAVDREKASQGQSAVDSDGHGVNGIDGEVKKEAIRFVRVPDAGAIQASEKAGQPINLCPICQEKFENRWHDGVQEWVWMDAVKAGTQGRVYHASCYDEVKKDQERAARRKIEEPVTTSNTALGRKRKMDDDAETPPTKSPRNDGDAW